MRIPRRRGGALVSLLATGTLAACSSSGGAASGSFCDQLRAASAQPADVTDAASAKVAYQRLIEQYRALVAVAPADIRADTKLVADQAQQSYELLAKWDFDLDKASADPDFAKVSASAIDPANKAAGDHLNAYASSTCGLDLQATPSTTAG